MKYFLTIILLSSVSAFACPNLSGKFECKEENETYTIEIAQTEANGITTYHIEGLNLVADGMKHSIPNEPDQLSDRVYFATCTDAALYFWLTGYETEDDKIVATLIQETNISIDASKNLSVDTKYEIKSSDGQTETEAYFGTCTRL